MAYLIKCRVCGGMVSSEATPPCPHCKDPFITETRKQERIEKERQKEEKERQSTEWRNKGLCPECGNTLLRYSCLSPISSSGGGVYSEGFLCSICDRNLLNAEGISIKNNW